MNSSRDFTVVIKTFLRPVRLSRCLGSVRRFLPEVPIIVADDGSPFADETISLPHDVEHLKLPFDSGISKGRNEAVRRVKTPYTVIFDDDFVVDEKHPLYDGLDFLVKNPTIDIVTYRLWRGPGTGAAVHFASRFEVRAGTLRRVPCAPAPGSDHVICDMGLNCFTARTEKLLASPWDDDLKVGEHWDFFYRFPGRVAVYFPGDSRSRSTAFPRTRTARHRRARARREADR
jgi:hypothetical protein